MPGTDGMAGCPPVVECCPGYVPKGRYYVTFTNVGTGTPGCDCVPTVVVPIDLYSFGDYDTHPLCPGCKVGERWSGWRGYADHAECFSGEGTVRFCVRLDCDPAGAGVVCGSFALAARITCGGFGPTPACDYVGDVVAVGPPDSCTCDPFYLRWDFVTNLENPGSCCRNSAGDVVAGQWRIEVTE